MMIPAVEQAGPRLLLRRIHHVPEHDELEKTGRNVTWEGPRVNTVINSVMAVGLCFGHPPQPVSHLPLQID